MDIEYFWKFVDVKEETECWKWKRYLNSQGYGQVYIKGRPFLAHRIAFMLSGNILTNENPCVLHRCDNPSCCNPSHLFSGSVRDNNIDMIKKGRARYLVGEQAYNHKLTTHDVIIIKALINQKSLAEIGRCFNVSYTTIQKIAAGETWKHV